jgi:hypothetical protein
VYGADGHALGLIPIGIRQKKGERGKKGKIAFLQSNDLGNSGRTKVTPESGSDLNATDFRDFSAEGASLGKRHEAKVPIGCHSGPIGLEITRRRIATALPHNAPEAKRKKPQGLFFS